MASIRSELSPQFDSGIITVLGIPVSSMNCPLVSPLTPLASASSTCRLTHKHRLDSTHPRAFSLPIIAPASSKILAQSKWPALTALPSGVFPPPPPAAESLSSNDTPSCRSNDRVSV